MSFVRFGEDGSDVYIYDDIHFGLYCCGCDLEEAVCGEDYGAMLQHISLHRENGDFVPEYVDEQLTMERDTGSRYGN